MKAIPNLKVVFFSLIALVCLGLMYFVHWMFIIPAATLSWLNWRELKK